MLSGPALPELPRVPLLDGPTPLQPMPRLSASLGGRVELWIKREDLGPLAFSGNKLRNLEFLLGAAIADGADTIVTSGRRWSNHCRLTAAAGARLGLDVEIVVSGPPVASSANLDLIAELGATIHHADTEDRADREALVEQVAADARAAGRSVHVLPVGGSTAIGAWGHVLAALEVIEQAHPAVYEPGTIILPSATGGTQAGLVVGAAAASERAPYADGTGPAVVGILVAHPEEQLRPIVARLAEELADMIGIAPSMPIYPTADRIELDSTQLGEGYGRETDASLAAATLIARTEGILVDPIYTAKALAGLIEHVRSGRLDGQRVIFWHAGGLPALFEAG